MDVADLMSISDDLAHVNVQRYHDFTTPAKSMGIENHADMRKDELVTAIRNASKAS
jgi:hypothetical protein